MEWSSVDGAAAAACWCLEWSSVEGAAAACWCLEWSSAEGAGAAACCCLPLPLPVLPPSSCARERAQEPGFEVVSKQEGGVFRVCVWGGGGAGKRLKKRRSNDR